MGTGKIMIAAALPAREEVLDEELYELISIDQSVCTIVFDKVHTRTSIFAYA